MVNLKLAFRTLFKTPFVTLVAIASLALGIGANAAMFSMFDQVLLRQLPVPDPERLVNLGAPGPKPGSQSCNNAGECTDVFSYAMFRDLERAQDVFTGIAAHRLFGANLAYKGQTLSGEGLHVSGSYFPVLGARPAIGRLLGPGDDPTVGQAPVVVLSHAYWRTRFNEDPAVLNDTLIVNGQPLTIVGVVARGFEGTTLGARPQVYVPITLRGLMEPGFTGFDNRRSYWTYLFARLKPGVSVEGARAAINGPYRAIVNEVESSLQQGMSDTTMARFKAKEVTLGAGARGQSSLHREARAPLTLLLGVTAFVLLIACANIANLLLARAATRAGEMAIRLSIGASRRQLIAQLLAESCLLAAIGGLLGLVVARWTLNLIATLLPPEAAQAIVFEIDRNALIFTAALTLGTGLLFGLFPAIHSTQPDLVSTLKEQAGQKGSSRAAARFRTALATAQIALSMALLVAAGLFTRSLLNVSRVNLGLDVENVVTFAISPRLNGYTVNRSRALFERIEESLSALPGVTGVTAAIVPMLAGDTWGSSVRVQGFDAGPDTDTSARYNEVGPGYFRTMGVPLLTGREFTTADVLGAPRVAIVNEAFAQKFNLGRDVVGKRMGRGDGQELDTEIIGLVRNMKYSEVKQDIPPLFFRAYRQNAELGAMNFYVRTSLAPAQVMPSIEGAVKRLDANLPIEGLKTLPQVVRENVFVDRLVSTLSTAFAGLATLLAAIGLYGVLSYTVAQRTKEIGLRMALGADGTRVRRMILRQVVWMTLIGGAAGLTVAVGFGRLAASMLFELQGYDPIALAGAAVVLTLVALGAGLIPAQRAASVDPMRALRYE